MRKIILFIVILLHSKFGLCKEHFVQSESELTSVIKILKPGDVVTIANGSYKPWSTNINAQGTAAEPIVIQAETKGRVTFSGNVYQPIFKLIGSYITLKGINFNDCKVFRFGKETGVLVELYNSNNCRLTQCTFEKNSVSAQYIPIVVVSGNSLNVRIDSCKFISNLDNQDIQVRVRKIAFPKSTVIENNIFSDKSVVRWPGNNGGECIQIGQDNVLLGNLRSNSIVRSNRFIRCKGDAEVISNKSSGNTYSKNYFEDCIGELVIRGGNDCNIVDNIIKGGYSGIRINGTGHSVTGNRISNVKVGIRLMYGMSTGRNGLGFYITASDCTIADNYFDNVGTGILLGDGKNVDWTGKFDPKRYPSRQRQDIRPSNNKVLNNRFIGTLKEVVNN